MPRSPWLADAAVDATMQSYEIRTVTDFLKVPESRRYICLREFHSWLYMQTATVNLLVAFGLDASQIQLRQPDVFIWHDDGQAKITVTLEERQADPAPRKKKERQARRMTEKLTPRGDE